MRASLRDILLKLDEISEGKLIFDDFNFSVTVTYPELHSNLHNVTGFLLYILL